MISYRKLIDKLASKKSSKFNEKSITHLNKMVSVSRTVEKMYV